MSLAVRVVGVGDAFTARYWNASVLVETATTRLLVDAPPALARALAAQPDPLTLDQIDHVLITHLHGDHVGGLEQLLFWRRFVTQRKCTLHAIPAVLAEIWDARLAGSMRQLMDPDGTTHALTLADYAHVVPLEPRSKIGDLEVEWRPTIHHVPTSALRFHAGGRTLGFSADTAFDPSLIEWLAASDLYFHETNYGVHTPLEKLAALPPRLTERLRLIHYPDDLDPGRAPLPCAREGERHEL
jgi:ribonuclease BN (tRNA processing enzyme)